MSECGCTTQPIADFINGKIRDIAIIYCPMHESAAEMLNYLKAMWPYLLDRGEWLIRVDRLIAKASQPGKEKQ